MFGMLRSQNCLGGIADRLDIVTGIEKGDDPAGTAFEPLVTPGEGTDQSATVEHQLNVAAEILGMQQALLERPHVKRKDVGRDLSSGLLVRELESAEEFARGLAVALGKLCGQIGPHVADGSIHCVIA